MAKSFDLKKQLKLHTGALLKRLFTGEHKVLLGVPWDQLKPHDVSPIVENWDTIPHDSRRQIEVILHDVNELCLEKSHKALIEKICEQYPDRVNEFTALASLPDKALWAYLEAPKAFDEAAILARADSLRNGQFANRWNSLPKQPLQITEGLKANLENAIRDYYKKKELRSDQCKVHHYTRANGEDFFYTYLPEWADKRLAFDADGNLTPREMAYAFSNVFIFEPANGALEIIARGGLGIQKPLRRVFCKSVLGLEVDDDAPIKTSYHLDHILDPSFAFTTLPEDTISCVHVRRLGFYPRIEEFPLENGKLQFMENLGLHEIREFVEKFRNAFGLKPPQISVEYLSLQLEFQGDGKRKPRTMTFNISAPNTCDLKSKPDDVREIGQRCIRRWRFLRD